MKQTVAPPWDALTEEQKDQYGNDAYGRVQYENLRRDGKAEWREWRAYRLAGSLVLAVLVLAIGFVIFALRGQRVQAMVQVVQVDEEKRLVKVGVPVDLLDFDPPEGEWKNMLTHWVKKRHWRGEEESDVRARDDWRWLYLHACGYARKQLDEAEKAEKPFHPSTKRVKVDIDAITKDVVPGRFHVFWKSTTTDKYNPKADEQQWTTTFTVGRVVPQKASDAILNNLGLCVTAVDDAKSF
jgi:hypothetical protein